MHREDAELTPRSQKKRQERLQSIGDALAKVAAFDAKASSLADQLAIWHRIADPALRRHPLYATLPWSMVVPERSSAVWVRLSVGVVNIGRIHWEPLRSRSFGAGQAMGAEARWRRTH